MTGMNVAHSALPLPPGTKAPDFELPATSDKTISLTDFRGQPVILAFYPADRSPVCSDQMALYQEVLPEFQKFNAVLLGISVDGIWCHLAFAKDRNLHFPLLSDFEPKGEVARTGERLRFVFRNFPITTSHPHAEQAAEAAEAAATQGRFWPMHDLLYENQRNLGGRDLRAYAEQLALDVELFDTELAGHVHAERVHEDFMSGVRSGVNGTPTFYVNGARHDDSYDLETLLAALERGSR